MGSSCPGLLRVLQPARSLGNSAVLEGLGVLVVHEQDHLADGHRGEWLGALCHVLQDVARNVASKPNLSA